MACIAIGALMMLASNWAQAQFTGQRVTLDRRYPTDTKVPSKYGTQIVAKDGAQFLAGPCAVRITAAQVEVTLSTLYNKYTFADTTCNGYRLTISTPQSAIRNPQPHALPPPVTNVTVDPHTNLPGFDSSRISWSGSYVQVNLAGLTFGVGDRLVLDVGFAPPAAPKAPRKTVASPGALKPNRGSASPYPPGHRPPARSIGPLG